MNIIQLPYNPEHFWGHQQKISKCAYKIFDKKELLTSSYTYSIDQRNHYRNAQILKTDNIAIKFYAMRPGDFIDLIKDLPDEQKHGFVFIYKSVVIKTEKIPNRVYPYHPQIPIYWIKRDTKPGLVPYLVDDMQKLIDKGQANKGQSSNLIRVLGHTE